MPTASLHARGVRVALGTRVILDGVDIALDPGRRVGVVGPNGVGKTTLLRVLAGEIRPDAGDVVRAPRDATVGHLAQEPERRADETVVEMVMRRTGVTDATAELEAATTALAEQAPGADDRYATALDVWLSLGGPDVEARIGATWADLGLDERLLTQPTSTLSGGEAARAGLAALLASRYDVYLLDEPTNDLDLDGLARLEQWLLGSTAATALVSHDRAFLARCVTHVAEIDEFRHHVTTFAGGWEAFLAERETARRHAQEAFDDYAGRRGDLLARAQREREWASQGLARAKKRPDDNDKFVRRFRMDQTEQLAARAARTAKAIERLDAVDEPREAWQLRFTIGAAERSGRDVAELRGAVVEREGFRLGPIDIHVAAGERIAITGHNGSGKSTLLAALLGRAHLASGESRMGPGVIVGEIEQARQQLDGSAPLLDVFMRRTQLSIPDARTLLAKFGVTADHVGRPVASLSPGERTRAVLALLQATKVNCLVLDEPTNHLDLAAIEQLETALDAFAGTVLLVTHDRQMLATVRLTRVVELASGRVVADRPA